ncbi:MAG: type 1 glutamine amidotransferase [Verrucomicrobiales bacterium]|nr:type 1 glutamine amidotransferase [Verrucomicrobiales bacterium]
MNLACVMNHPAESAGLIGSWCDERGHRLENFAAFESRFPEGEDFDALVVMGGPHSVNDATEDKSVRGALGSVRSFLSLGKPVFGVCLGAQMLAVELGGKVQEGLEKEIGWYPIAVQDPGGDHLLSGLPAETVVFHWHGEQIQLPPDAQLLASSEVCPVQAFEAEGGILGLQCHLEVDSGAMERMIRAFAGEVAAGGPGVMGPEEMELGLQKWGDSCRRSLFSILDRWEKLIPGTAG